MTYREEEKVTFDLVFLHDIPEENDSLVGKSHLMIFLKLVMKFDCMVHLFSRVLKILESPFTNIPYCQCKL